ncbi:O-antigen ligase domain-containing protein [Rufibacter immobilis]|uniref:O-antigen ligase domain-containing protein n=1 Tax=Rufibacter immobilis TaxID=1348778 RepID=A0A3M9N591_9BACT|nr:O-antigen ligase family protein [Rufibacter immobilis]RNI32974.1 O-antigen ligase domain-containing protein [Rufibacter immobilis]
MHEFISTSASRTRSLALPLGILAAIGIGWLTATNGFQVPGLLMALFLTVVYIALVMTRPKLGLVSTITYCFVLFILVRESKGIPFGLGIDALLLISCVSVLLTRTRGYIWNRVNNDLCLLALIWFGITVLELANPAGASVMGWLQEMRSSALYWLLITPLVFILFRQKSDLNLFLFLVLALSVLAALNGAKQVHLGLSPGEQWFLDQGAAKTHVLFGKLRTFSFYSDAGQFGASQAHIGLVALILAFGPFKWWKKGLLLVAAGILFYGMLVSGTRGALFALVVGVAVALFLSKSIKTLILGTALVLTGLYGLKYTQIGNQHYEIRRLRSSLNPEDASLNVRFQNQKILREYLSSRPFGGGVGVIGHFGRLHNADKYLSTIPPDSYWVKVWAMYGIVGFMIWIGMVMYILGKCCGIVWGIQNKSLKTKLIALTAGSAGIIICSYGNEVINNMPSSIIVYASWALVFMSPRLDNETQPDSDE